jgi:purine-binding chemotaxis protein CheW
VDGAITAQTSNQAIVERAERLRAEQRTSQRRSEPLALVTFRLGPEVYALPADQVRGVIARQPVVPIPSTPSHLLGITNFRGEVLPVFDLNVLLGLSQEPGQPEYFIIARPGADSAALGCDSCPDIMQVAAEDMDVSQAAAPSPASPYLRGHCVTQQSLINVLDVDKVLQP